MDRAETRAFNEDFLPFFHGWHSRIEYAPGGTVGFGDALLLFDGKFLPLEVKIGEERKNRIFAPVRASQTMWHKSITRAGGVSAFFVKCGDLFWLVAGIFVDEIKSDLNEFEPMIKSELKISLMDRLRFVFDAGSSVPLRKIAPPPPEDQLFRIS